MIGIEKEIRFIDLFGGVGGFRLGLERANSCISQSKKWESKERRDRTSNEQGTQFYDRQNTPFSCVWYCDNDKYAVQTYNKNFGTDHKATDIRGIQANDIPEHDMLCAGFPCQAFSIAGKRRGFEDTRGTLFFEIARILETKRPTYLFLENVKGLLSHEEGKTFKTILRTLDDLGYDIQWMVLNSKFFGVPQNRERVFIIGSLRGKSRPKILPIKESNEVDIQQNKKLPEQISNTLRTNYGGGYSNETYTLGRKESYALDSNYYKGTNTLEKGRRQMVYDKNSIRRLTPVECERLQSFPDNWTEGVSDTQRYKQMGNAVTVNVIEAIGRKLGDVIE